jgi:hypothetical protein
MHETILVVDDEPKIVKLARDYLERGGFRVFTSADGTTALAIARHERPDLLHTLLATNLGHFLTGPIQASLRAEETGLAITPRMTVEDGRVRIDDASWGITHLDSGSVPTEGRWFDNPIEAEGLVSILAQIDWRRPTEAISRREVDATRQVIKSHNEALAQAKATCPSWLRHAGQGAAPTGAGKEGDRVLAGSGMQLGCPTGSQMRAYAYHPSLEDDSFKPAKYSCNKRWMKT